MPPKKSTSAAKAAPANKAAPKAAAAAAAPASAATAPATKANGKKRAAADEADSTPAKKTTAAASKGKKLATKKAAASSGEDATDVNERAIIASLSDVSADSSDDDDDDFEDDAANSSDEDDEDDRAAASAATQPRSSLASVKLPNSKDDAVVRARLDKLRKSKSKSSGANTTPGVLYIGRLPRGFFEKQLKAYFTQFGDVTRLRVSRNKKTGASKHYAFVEFADRDVAKIVQETMHNYLIDGRLLQVKEVAKDKVHPELWVGANRKFQKVPGDRVERVVRSRVKTEEEQKRTNERAIKRQDARREKLHKLGIEYEFPGYANEGEEQKKKASAAKVGTPAKAKGKTAKA
ncbi:RNA recognition motif domain protein [Kalmanozyma brasiliensis GHG001]|uniref:RRM domain-containing protein n=1 Tax=Kalmanozyma brasiliensis (strain GHG001) TaxID=1365824 RepID=V5GEV1_KALBG|nr:RNA recognition motif domain protein [Kalmanozyma brasiliensis GHG001]EST04532.1 RNA recognition motif domain protein [Kalmanozyma brasiliensis GHG001]